MKYPSLNILFYIIIKRLSGKLPIFAEYNSKTIYMNKREYAKANLEWLAEKAKEEGVKSLPRGIYYKVLSEGNADGKHLHCEIRINGEYKDPADYIGTSYRKW